MRKKNLRKSFEKWSDQDQLEWAVRFAQMKIQSLNARQLDALRTDLLCFLGRMRGDRKRSRAAYVIQDHFYPGEILCEPIKPPYPQDFQKRDFQALQNVISSILTYLAEAYEYQKDVRRLSDELVQKVASGISYITALEQLQKTDSAQWKKYAKSPVIEGSFRFTLTTANTLREKPGSNVLIAQGSTHEAATLKFMLLVARLRTDKIRPCERIFLRKGRKCGVIYFASGRTSYCSPDCKNATNQQTRRRDLAVRLEESRRYHQKNLIDRKTKKRRSKG